MKRVGVIGAGLTGGIHERNIRKIVEQNGAREVHVAAPMTIASPMEYRNDRCFMGGELWPPEFAREVTDPGRIWVMLGAIR